MRFPSPADMEVKANLIYSSPYVPRTWGFEASLIYLPTVRLRAGRALPAMLPDAALWLSEAAQPAAPPKRGWSLRAQPATAPGAAAGRDAVPRRAHRWEAIARSLCAGGIAVAP